MNTAIIFNDDFETKIAIMEEDVLVNFFICRKKEKTYVGKIIKARVEKILKKLNIAFLDRGNGEKLFLDINNFNRDEIIENKEILVKITEDAINSKKIKCSSECILLGKYINYIPRLSLISFSRKIKDENFKKNMINLLKQNLEKEDGVIVRNFSYGTEFENIIRELKFLKEKWKTILEKKALLQVGDTVYEGENIIEVFLKNYDIKKFDKIFIDNEKNYDDILNLYSVFLKKDDIKKFQIFRKEENVIEYFGINNQIRRALKNKVNLICGGNILIEKTEALTSIDVNLASSISFTSSNSIYETNLNAAKEIANQIRLRNLSGIIVIDFITTNSSKHKKNILEIFMNEIKKDNIPIDNISFGNLCLLIFTRKKVGNELSKYFLKKGDMSEKNEEFSCEYISLEIIRDILEKTEENIKVIELSASRDIIEKIENLYLNDVTKKLIEKNKKLILKKIENGKKNYEINFYV